MYREDKELSAPGRTAELHELAEAIRRGCELTSYQEYGPTIRLNATCALGAAQIARGIPAVFDKKGKWVNQKGLAREFRCLSGWRGEWLMWRISWRNDVRRKSREAIADWLDSL
jgi:hypothetical protein